MRPPLPLLMAALRPLHGSYVFIVLGKRSNTPPPPPPVTFEMDNGFLISRQLSIKCHYRLRDNVRYPGDKDQHHRLRSIQGTRTNTIGLIRSIQGTRTNTIGLIRSIQGTRTNTIGLDLSRGQGPTP